jgi:hypothetical protein
MAPQGAIPGRRRGPCGGRRGHGPDRSQTSSAFVLGHAWALRALPGCTTRCDRKDTEAIARLLKGGAPPAKRPP